MSIKIFLSGTSKKNKPIDINYFNNGNTLQMRDIDKESLSIFNSIDKDGNGILTRDEFSTGTQSYSIVENLLASRYENTINGINAQNVHAVLGLFHSLTSKPNTTNYEAPRRNPARIAANGKLTLPQAIVNSRLDAKTKKEYLLHIKDAVAKASEQNTEIENADRELYIKAIETYIEKLDFNNENADVDIVNVLIDKLLPNNDYMFGSIEVEHEYEAFLTEVKNSLQPWPSFRKNIY